MKWVVVIPLLALALGARAQAPSGDEASDAQSRVVEAIVECLAAGLPQDWQRAVMDVNLGKPLDETGTARYMVVRGERSEVTEPFVPCDSAKPVRILIEARQLQLEERRGWIDARLFVLRDGRFGIRYGYPPKQ